MSYAEVYPVPPSRRPIDEAPASDQGYLPRHVGAGVGTGLRGFVHPGIDLTRDGHSEAAAGEPGCLTLALLVTRV